MQVRVWRRRCRPVAVAFTAALLNACPVVGHYTGSETNIAFRAGQVAKIERNQTTKRQIIEWFGLPQTFARKEASSAQESVPTPVDFKLFAASQTISDGSVVYYYRNVSSTWSQTDGGVSVLPVPGGGGFGGTLAKSASDEGGELWILFDGRTGLVQDYIVKGPR